MGPLVMAPLKSSKHAGLYESKTIKESETRTLDFVSAKIIQTCSVV